MFYYTLPNIKSISGFNVVADHVCCTVYGQLLLSEGYIFGMHVVCERISDKGLKVEGK